MLSCRFKKQGLFCRAEGAEHIELELRRENRSA